MNRKKLLIIINSGENQIAGQALIKRNMETKLPKCVINVLFTYSRQSRKAFRNNQITCFLFDQNRNDVCSDPATLSYKNQQN